MRSALPKNRWWKRSTPGLECGIIGAKYDGMDMISFGPTIKSPHSPEEKIEIESIGQVWDFMVALFESYK